MLRAEVMRNPESVSEKKYKPPLRVRVAVVALSIVVGLLIFEVFLRALGFTYPIFYQPDEARGYALRPGIEGWYRKEGAAFVRINREGLRDREHSKPKPEGAFRIALLGDSYAEAFQVEQEKAFWSALERRLQECAALNNRKVEVINFGVSGYGTTQELITLRERVWDYSPDVVLLAVTTNNDVLDNSRTLKNTDEIPYFILDGEQLKLDNSFRDTTAFKLRNSALNRAGRWLRDKLCFVQAIHLGQAALKSRLDAWRESRAAASATHDAQKSGTTNAASSVAAATPQQSAPTDEPGVANMIYREPSDDTWRGAWLVIERLMGTMHKEVESRGARFVVVTLSNGIQVHPDASARAAFARRLGVTDLFYAERRLRELGERESFPVINLAPELQAYADEHNTFLHGFGQQLGNGHWNEEGHRVAGEILTRKLCEQLAP